MNKDHHHPAGRPAAFCFIAALSVLASTVRAEAITAEAALQRLIDGNLRYAAGQTEHPRQSAERRAELAKGQAPFAIVLACADSRVAPEIVFDQGLGDLFVVRVAGNVLDNHALGSIEYAVEHLHASLIVVLGHERCGAVTAAVQGGHAPGHIHSLVQAIEPAVAAARSEPGDAVENATRANVLRVVAQLRQAEPILAEHVKSAQLQVVGGRYDLDTGAVELLR